MENSKWGGGSGVRWDLDGGRQPKCGDVQGGGRQGRTARRWRIVSGVDERGEMGGQPGAGE